MRVVPILAAALLALAATPALAHAQEPPVLTGASQAPAQPPNLEKIREAVNRPPQIKIDNGQLRIYVEVIGKWPSFSEIVKGYDLRNGPVPRSAMTHAEFLSMVTPKEMYSSAGIGATEMLQAALVNWAGKALILKGLEAIRNARSEREIEEIRARIDRELAALRGK